MNKVLLTCIPLLVCNSLAACFYDYISHGLLRAYVIFAVLAVVLVTRDSHIDEESDRTKQKEYVKGELTSLQVEPLARRRWKDVLVWIAFSREEILWKDSKHQTILHHAVLFQAPVEVVNLILLEAPELATMANKDGELPLHWAVRLSLSNHVLRALLMACPTAGVYARDDEGNTPLSLLWDRHQDSLLRLWWTNKQFVLQSPSWQRIMSLMRFSYFRTTDCPIACDPGALDLHIAASCPCPPAMFPLVLRVYHNHLDEQDHEGRTPLFIACSDGFCNRNCDVLTKVNMILSQYEGRATVNTKDDDGNHPFCAALAAGVTWDEGIERFVQVCSSLVTSVPPQKGKQHTFPVSLPRPDGQSRTGLPDNSL